MSRSLAGAKRESKKSRKAQRPKARPESDCAGQQSEASPKDLEEVLTALDGACKNGDGKKVSMGEIMDGIGRRTFGPLMILPALLVLTPLGAIPGLPTAAASVVLLIAGQMFFGMDHVWIPQFMEKRKIGKRKLEGAVRKAMPAVRVVDALLRPRLTIFTREPFLHVTLALCILAAAVTPLLELVPMAAAVPNAAIVIFGLSIIAHDGLLAVIATFLTIGAVALIFTAL